MSSHSRSYSLSFVHSMIPNKTSSLPRAVIACRSAKSFGIHGAMINDETFNCSAASAYSATELTNGPLLSTRDMSLTSPRSFDEPTGRRSSTIRPDTADYSSRGIGILDFLAGKCYFVTGGTGMLAKAFVEKILRVAPSTRKIFLLVKAKDEDEALKRIKTEIVECGLFKRLEEMHGENYIDFMMSKLIPVVGNLSEPGLGISNLELANQMAEEVDVIINSAANTTLDERYDVALNLNTKGPFRLLSFAMKCKNLQLFMQISTAFVNGERQGVVREMPFHMGQTIAEEMANTSGTQQSFPVHKLDVHDEIKLITKMIKSLPEDDAAKKMKELGMERARMFGWQNTYLFTKAMGEMMISSYKGNIPIAIIRPSIIESTYSEPFPGWIQGCRVMDPLIISYGKGLLPGHLADPDALVDIVPLDMVVNTMVLAMAKHGSQPDSGLNVYQVASAVTNPLSYHEMFEYSCDHFMSSPLLDTGGEAIRIERMKFISSLDEFSAYIQDEVAERMGLRGQEECNMAKVNEPYMAKLKVLCKRTVGNLTHMAKVYEPYMFYKGWFDNGNTQKLIGEMSMDESRMFPVDFKSVNWKNYFQNIHIPGLKKHILKGRRSVIE